MRKKLLVMFMAACMIVSLVLFSTLNDASFFTLNDANAA